MARWPRVPAATHMWPDVNETSGQQPLVIERAPAAVAAEIEQGIR